MNGTDFRLFYEKYGRFKLAEYLNISPVKIKHLTIKNPTGSYDLEYKDVKYDVKFSNPVLTSKTKKMPIWDFSLRKVKDGKRKGQDYKYCDYFLLIGMTNGIPKKTFLIPTKKCPTNHIRISIKGLSKYNEYII